jgi:dihydrodipicolinate synthase/N-acetylneuraminate lyase
VDPAYATALAALAGSIIGGLTSLGTTWLTQNKQMVTQFREQDKVRRQELYKEFVEEASALYADALSHTLKDASKLVGLYAKVSRMRILSSEAVVEAAEQVLHAIGEIYLGPNLTLDELLKRPPSSVDLLKGFSECCRADLRSRGYL